MPTSEIAQFVQSFATELVALVRRETIGELQKLLEAHVGEQPRRRAPRGKTATSHRGARAVDKTGLSKAVLAFVRANPGARSEQIAAAVGGTSDAIRPAVKALMKAGGLRSEGERRGMRYFADGGAVVANERRDRGEEARAEGARNPKAKKVRGRRTKRTTTTTATVQTPRAGVADPAGASEGASDSASEESAVPF